MKIAWTLLLLISLSAYAEPDFYFVQTDHLGTPRALYASDSDTVVWKADYKPFGEATVDQDPDGDNIDIVMPIRFPGQYYDNETGLHYNYFRDYDPSLGRYVQSDPIGLTGGLNTYGYALQSPLVYDDPFGLCTYAGTDRFGNSMYDCNTQGDGPYRDNYSPSGDNATYNPYPETTACMRNCLMKSLAVGEAISQSSKLGAKVVEKRTSSAALKSIAKSAVKKIPAAGHAITVATLPSVLAQCKSDCEELEECE